MPTNVVKTKRDEALWERAKRIVSKQKNVKDHYALVMHIYQRLKKAHKYANARYKTKKKKG